MDYQEGYVYHIKDEYFIKANDPNLMQNNNPVPVKYSIQTEISTKMKRILQLHARGKKIVFPDISRLESLMLNEATSAES